MLVGREAGASVPVIEGLPADATEDRPEGRGAAAASSGAVGLFHAVGLTPEAPTLAEAALGGAEPQVVRNITAADLREAAAAPRRVPDGPLDAVSVGTPHFSVAEFAAFRELLGGRRCPSDVKLYASTSREVLEEVETPRLGWRS